LTTEIGKISINDLVKHLTTEHYTGLILKQTNNIYPLQNVTIRKVKVVKKPKIDAIKINEMYSHEKETKKTGKQPKGVETQAATEEEGTQNLLTKK